MKKFISECKNRVLAGEELSYDDAYTLLHLDIKENLLLLMDAANSVRREFKGDKIDMCALVNAKSGHCSEDCKFCAQSSHYNTSVNTYPLLDVDTIVEKAREAKQLGVSRFCIVTSGDEVTDGEFEQIVKAVRTINTELKLEMDCSLGALSAERILTLKAAGMSRYNHNIETSPEYYEKICSTHVFDKRVKTINRVKESGVETCCGGIIGMGESHADQLALLFKLKELKVNCVPINILNPRPGTPLENVKCISPMEVLKTISVFRLVLPKATIKVAGGREKNLRSLQSISFLAGANGMIVNGYLTTTGQSPEEDLQMLKDLDLYP